MSDHRPAMRRGIPRKVLYERLGEPTTRATRDFGHSRVAFEVWFHDWNESPVPCEAVKFVPPDCEQFPDDDWFIHPCPLHEHLFSEFPEAPVGTPMWRAE